MTEAHTPVGPDLRAEVARLLGREPRGLRDVPICRENGTPMVIRVASLVDDKPFPTLYWLVDPAINYRIDTAEAGGLIKRLQRRVDAEPALQAAMRRDHQRYIAARNDFMTARDLARLRALNFYEGLQSRGIGGIADIRFIRCLHTWYGAHLVEPNTIGQLLDDHWREECAA